MSDEEGLDRESFNSNYAILKHTADWLAKQAEPDIDQLVPKVERAMQAYAICKERLTMVQQTLGQYLGQDESIQESPPPPTTARDRRGKPRAPSADGDADAADDPF
jgi:exonuclease VII small subunit